LAGTPALNPCTPLRRKPWQRRSRRSNPARPPAPWTLPHARSSSDLIVPTGINWSERGNLSLEPGSTDVLEAGMTFHMPIILFEENRYGLGCSENVVVTERGAEILSMTPHTLYRA
jgi:hypothetical protein